MMMSEVYSLDENGRLDSITRAVGLGCEAYLSHEQQRCVIRKLEVGQKSEQ